MSEPKQIERLPDIKKIEPLIADTYLLLTYYEKIQEIIDYVNELEKNTIDTFNLLLDKLQK